MSDPYKSAKGGRLAFKGGGLAPLKAMGKKKTKKKKKTDDTKPSDVDVSGDVGVVSAETGGGGEEIYTIDAAKRMKYGELFPVEAKKFGYEAIAQSRSVEEALDDRVKKKADRYCK